LLDIYAHAQACMIDWKFAGCPSYLKHWNAERVTIELGKNFNIAEEVYYELWADHEVKIFSTYMLFRNGGLNQRNLEVKKFHSS